jgi:hypothetical protein
METLELSLMPEGLIFLFFFAGTLGMIWKTPAVKVFEIQKQMPGLMNK